MSTPLHQFPDFLREADPTSRSLTLPGTPDEDPDDESPWQRALAAIRRARGVLRQPGVAEAVREGAAAPFPNPIAAAVARTGADIGRELVAETGEVARDVPRQVGRQAAEGGIGLLEGAAQLVTSGGPTGVMAEGIAEAVGLPPLNRLQDPIREAAGSERERVAEFYGDPETTTGAVSGMLTRFGVEASPYAGTMRGARAPELLNRASRIAQGAARGAPIDLAFGLSSPENTIAGAGAALLETDQAAGVLGDDAAGVLGGGLRAISRFPPLAALTEVTVGTGLGALMDVGEPAARAAAARAGQEAVRRTTAPVRWAREAMTPPTPGSLEDALSRPIAGPRERLMAEGRGELRPMEPMTDAELTDYHARQADQVMGREPEFQGELRELTAAAVPEDLQFELRAEAARMRRQAEEEGKTLAEVRGLRVDPENPPTRIEDVFTERELEAIRRMETVAAEAPQTWDLPLEERVPIRLGAARELYGNGAPQKNYEAWVILGPPGSGKSSVVVKRLMAEHGTLEIDADAAAKLLPEYNGTNRGALQDEASYIAEDLVLGEAKQHGDNIVLPKVGKSVESVMGRVRELKEAGYKVHAVLVDLPVEESALRAWHRALEDGRFTSPGYIIGSVDGNPRRVFDELQRTESGTFASFQAFDNNVPKGSPPRVRELSPTAAAAGEAAPAGRAGGRDADAGAPLEPQAAGRADAGGPSERIVAAAVRDPDTGQLDTGAAHWIAHENLGKKLGRTLYAGQLEDGFVTSSGRFVSRQEAFGIARAADQLEPGVRGRGAGRDATIREELGSEDVEGLWEGPMGVRPPGGKIGGRANAFGNLLADATGELDAGRVALNESMLRPGELEGEPGSPGRPRMGDLLSEPERPAAEPERPPLELEPTPRVTPEEAAARQPELPGLEDLRAERAAAPPIRGERDLEDRLGQLTLEGMPTREAAGGQAELDLAPRAAGEDPRTVAEALEEPELQLRQHLESRPHGEVGSAQYRPEKDDINRPTIDGKRADHHPIGKPTAGPVGRDVIITTADGTKYASRYRVVEADELIQSHDPITFAPNDRYPGPGIQERDYAREAGYAEHVQNIARRFDATRALDPTRSPIEGPPIVRADGVVPGGNGRVMAIKRVYELHPEHANAYRERLLQDSRSFGLEPDEVAKMENPVLVRELDDRSVDLTDHEVLRELAAKLNDDPGKARGALADAYTRSQRMVAAQGALRHFTQSFDVELHRTIRRYLDSAAGEEFAAQLSSEGVIRPEELPEFYKKADGGRLELTPEGKDRIADLMELAAIGDQEVARRAPAGWRNKLEHAYPALIQASRIEDFDLGPMLREALNIGAAAQDAGLSVPAFLEQVDLFGRQPDAVPGELARFIESAKPSDVTVLELARFIDEQGPVKVKTAFREFALEAENAHASREHAGDLFGEEPRTAEEAFSERFGIDVPEGGFEWIKAQARRFQRKVGDPLAGLEGPVREARKAVIDQLEEAEAVMLGEGPMRPRAAAVTSPPSGPPRPPGKKKPGPTDPRFPKGGTLFNYARFDLDPTGSRTLRELEERLIREGTATRERVPWARVRKMADQLGMDPAELVDRARYQKEPMTDAQMLATADLLSDYANRIPATLEFLHKHRASMSAAEIETLERAVSVMESRMELLILRYGPESSQRGRSLNAMKIQANRSLDNPVAWYEQARRMLGPKANEADWSEIRARIQEFARNRDRAGLVEYIASLREASMWEKVATARKAGLLFGIKSHGKNFLSNAAFRGMEESATPVAWTLDQLARMAVNAISVASGHGAVGVRTKAGLGVQLARASWDGAKEGVREAWTIMKHDVVLEDALLKRDIYRRVNYKNRAMDFYVNKTLASYGAADRPFRLSAFQRSLREQAQVQAANEGLTGKLKRQRANELERDPTPEMVGNADAHAAWQVFQNRGVLGSVATGLKRSARTSGGEAAGFTAEQLFPFTMTPANVASRALEFSPLGLIRPRNFADVTTIFREAAKGNAVPEVQKRLVEQVSRAVVGTAAAVGAGGVVAAAALPAVSTYAMLSGFALAANGQMTGAYPEDQRTRGAWKASGKMENSVLWRGKWRRLDGVSPLGNSMALGANLYYALQDPELTTFGAIASALSTIGTTVTEQSFLRSAKEALETLEDPRGATETFIASQATSFLPTAVRQAAGVGVDTELDRTGSGVFPDELGGVGSRIQAAIPFLAGELPPSLDVFGQEIERDPGIVANMIDPLYSRMDRAATDPILAEMERVGAGIPQLRREAWETDEIWIARQKLYGARVLTAVKAAIQGTEYQLVDSLARRAGVLDPNFRNVPAGRMADEVRRNIIEDAADKARRDLSAELKPGLKAAGVER